MSGPTPMLAVTGLNKAFGALKATDEFNIEVERDEIHALIGPNGAGKTTLINQLSGEMSPDSGTILFEGRDITAMPAHLRPKAGLVRSYQITSVFPDFTTLDNVAMSIQARSGHSYRFFANARRDRSLRDPAAGYLDMVGLGAEADTLASNLAHGQQRQLEIAMALALEPKLLLLDEPMAGMGQEETARMVELLKGLKNSITMLLIEHDMDAVFALADRISVLVYGRVIATGAPEAIRDDKAVREAYLGDETED